MSESATQRLMALLSPPGGSEERKTFQANVDEIKEALRQGANPSAKTSGGYGIIELALMHDEGDYPWFKGGRPERPVALNLARWSEGLLSNEETMGFACEYSTGRGTDLVSFLIEEGVRPDGVDGSGWSFIASAAACNARTARLLLEKGANPNAVNPRDGGTPIFFASGKTTRMLLERGARVDVTSGEGFTPLHTAWEEEGARCLIDAGLSPSKRAEREREETPLHVASIGVARLLLRAGASPSDEDSEGVLPEDWALEDMRWETWMLLRIARRESVRDLKNMSEYAREKRRFVLLTEALRKNEARELKKVAREAERKGRSRL